jgi:hypothetical protein
MTTLVYLVPSDDLLSGIQTALDIYAASGIQPKIISDGITSVKFNPKDAHILLNNKTNLSKYTDKHRID